MIAAHVRLEFPSQARATRIDPNRIPLRLRFEAALSGPCTRCLEPCEPTFAVDAREVSQPGETDELTSPYVDAGVLDLRRWSRDALALALPAKLLCRPDCAGLCPVCGQDLNVEPHTHVELAGDPRWAALDELREQL